ncbi:uncharacterized protein TNCV_1219771 [Trichonephila clavipes]|nr:uncharacterized protein TNCV_1219771 [Trichonephila clavipes]
MMWFVREEFFSGSALFKSFKASPLSLLREPAVGLLLSSYILLVAGKESLVVQRLWGRSQGRPRNNFQNAASECTCDDYFHKETDSELCGGNRYSIDPCFLKFQGK